MLLKIILTTILLVILKPLNAQDDFDKDLKEVSGILIFPKTDSIPQDVIFLPLDKKHLNISDFKILLDSAVAQNSNIGSFLYFQGMRWRNPRLALDLKAAFQTTGLLIDVSKKMYIVDRDVQIVLGSIYFRDGSKSKADHTDTDLGNVKLKYKDNYFKLHVFMFSVHKTGYEILYKNIIPPVFKN